MSRKLDLREIVERLKKANLLLEVVGSIEGITITEVAYDSRKVTEGTLFLCKGVGFKADYIDQAIKQGAAAILGQAHQKALGSTPSILVSDIRQALVVVADVFFGSPWRKLNMIGVTGTKGKSTTVTMLKDIFDQVSKEENTPLAGITSSLRVYDGVLDEAASLTTPENIDLYRHMRTAVDAGIETMIVEVSSQAIKYGRVGRIGFDYALFLNISPDHISDVEHLDFEDYFQSKCRLFEQSRWACINLKTDRLDEVLKKAETCEHISTFAAGEVADFTACDIEQRRSGLSFDVIEDGTAQSIWLPMHGLFNVDNALAAITVARACDVSWEHIRKALAGSQMPGHMTYIYGEDITVLVDFAHNEISFKEVFASVKEDYPNVDYHVVFGAPGGKAQSRRQGMGKVASQMADYVYLTMDDPAFESVSEINLEIMRAYCMKVETTEIIDRQKAIEQAICEASTNSVVLILGKGNERAQKVQGHDQPWLGDEQVARHALELRSKQKSR